VVYDIIDNTKYFEEHGIKRLRYYDSEGFHIEEIDARDKSKIIF